MVVQREAAVRQAVEEGLARTLRAIETLPCNTADLFGADFDRTRDAGSKRLVEALEGLGGVEKGVVEQSVGELVRVVEGGREEAAARNVEQLAVIEDACSAEVAAAVARMEAVSTEDPRKMRAAVEQEQGVVLGKLRSMTAVTDLVEQLSRLVGAAMEEMLAVKTNEWVRQEGDSAVAGFKLAAGKLPVAWPADFDAAYQGLLQSLSAGLQARLRASGVDTEAETVCLAAFASAAASLEQAMVALNAEKLATVENQMRSSVALCGAKLDLLPVRDPLETARLSGEEVEATMRGFREAVPIEEKCEELRVTLESTAAAFHEGRVRCWASHRVESVTAEFDTGVAALPVTAEAAFSAAVGDKLRASVGDHEKELKAAGVSGVVANESVVALSRALKERVAGHEDRNRKVRPVQKRVLETRRCVSQGRRIQRHIF